MVNKEIITTISQKLNQPYDIVRKAIEAQFKRTKIAIENKESVRLSYLGFFKYKEKVKSKLNKEIEDEDDISLENIHLDIIKPFTLKEE